MEFCPKCGSVLIQKKKNDGCPRCNYSSKEKIKIKTSEKIEETKEIAIILSKDTETLPIITEICKKCRNGKAYFWSAQTRAGDEAETRFFRCTKCKHTWREYK